MLTAIKMSILVFWIVTPCRPVRRFQSFGGSYCHHLQGRWRQYDDPKFLYLSTNLHGPTVRETNIDILFIYYRRSHPKISEWRRGWEIYTVMTLWKTVCVALNWIKLAQYKYQYRLILSLLLASWATETWLHQNLLLQFLALTVPRIHGRLLGGT